MTTYRLPDGAEVRPADRNLSAVPTLANHTWVIHPTLGAISCYTGILTPVLPPLPPEPPIGTVLFDGGDRAWQRVRDDRDPPWRHDSLMCSWETMVRENGPLIRLVPDPADDAPELPLKLEDGPTGAWLATVKHSAIKGKVFMEVESTDYEPATARGIAAAIWRAAREVEQP